MKNEGHTRIKAYSSFKTYMQYVYLEDTAIADTAFEAFGKTIEELFENAAQAVANVMADTTKLRVTEEAKITAKANNQTNLLHNFLEEVIFFADEKGIAFKEFSVKITEANKTFLARGTGKGQNMSGLNATILKTEVKAVTWHQFKIEKTETGFKARVILDV